MMTRPIHSVQPKQQAFFGNRRRRAFTLIEAIAALACLVVFTLILAGLWKSFWSPTKADNKKAPTVKSVPSDPEKRPEPVSPEKRE